MVEAERQSAARGDLENVLAGRGVARAVRGVEMHGVAAQSRGASGEIRRRPRRNAAGRPRLRRAVDIEPAAAIEPPHQTGTVVAIHRLDALCGLEQRAVTLEKRERVGKGRRRPRQQRNRGSVRLREAQLGRRGEQAGHRRAHLQPRRRRRVRAETVQDFCASQAAQRREILATVERLAGPRRWRRRQPRVAEKRDTAALGARLGGIEVLGGRARRGGPHASGTEPRSSSIGPRPEA
ncbi:MAG: hypothetical protein WDO13_06085 [Verrucomicrobiota bacterium]